MKDIKKILKQILILIFFLIVVYSFTHPLFFPTSETADVHVWVTGTQVSDELLICYNIPIDNDGYSNIKKYESKPGWKFIILDLWMDNCANEIREYSNGWIKTKEGVVFRLYYVENQNHISLCEGNNSYSSLPVELKPDEGITTKIAVQVPLNEDINNLYLVYWIDGNDLEYFESGRIKITLWYYPILAYIYG